MGFEERVTRRALLRLGGRVVIGTTVSALFLTPATARAAPFARTFTWEQRDVSLADAPIISPPLACDFPFNALESQWDADTPAGSSLDFSIRTGADGGDWTEWMPLHVDDHARDDADDGTFGDLVIVAPATRMQYRIEAGASTDGGGPTLRALIFTAVDTMSDDLSPVTAREVAPTPKIIPRAGWGADERLRFDKKQQEVWPPEYRPIEKVVIHHTVTANPDPNPTATIRAIYQYHAVTRGWGDIGYNFLIDPDGRIYEGRHGGAGVVGGHTYGYNYGSMGIAMLGTYSARSITDAARTALEALIHDRAGHLDPLGKGFFVNRENVWNISGHRSLTQTDCPGDRFYLSFANLRRALKGVPQWTGDPDADPLAANPPDAAGPPPASAQPAKSVAPPPVAKPILVRATLADVSWSATTVYARDPLTVRLTIKNTGTAALPAGTPAPTYIYTEGETYAKKGFPVPRGALRIAIGPPTRPNDPPYRWGLERDLPPGETATLAVAMRARAPGRVQLAVTLRREGYIVLDQTDPQAIIVLANPTDPVPAAQAKDGIYVAETRHTIAGAIRAQWEMNGGAALFGLPITESFAEKNGDDGKMYIVQYFERARFEVHPGKDGAPDRVELGRLGSIAARGRGKEAPFARVAAVAETAERRFFPEVGHLLSGTFKAFWETHGGLAVFGFPISEPFAERSATDGKTYTVQYFERHRFERHPEKQGQDGEVALGLLGSEILRARGWLQ